MGPGRNLYYASAARAARYPAILRRWKQRGTCTNRRLGACAAAAAMVLSLPGELSLRRLPAGVRGHRWADMSDKA